MINKPSELVSEAPLLPPALLSQQVPQSGGGIS